MSQINSTSNRIFVFGSNLRGRHGKGAALTALRRFGAIEGRGIGHYGMSYAIPTKDEYIKTLSLVRIKSFVEEFLEYAQAEIGILEFNVTRIGCGLAGYKDKEIAPMFKPLQNCYYDRAWNPYFDYVNGPMPKFFEGEL